jgi:hypothetical protein
MGEIVRDARLTSRSRQARYTGRVARTATLLQAANATQLVHPRIDPVRVLKALGFVLLPITFVLLCGWFLGAQRRALAALPAAQREVAYAKTLSAFEAMCVSPAIGLEAQCRTQARFLLDFPECDEHCRQLAGAQMRVGRRA